MRFECQTDYWTVFEHGRADGMYVTTAGVGRGTVELQTSLGVLRALDLPAGAQLPRIC